MNIQNVFNTTQLMLNRKACSPLQNSRSTQLSKRFEDTHNLINQLYEEKVIKEVDDLKHFLR